MDASFSCRKPLSRGFTLLEMMVTLAIAAVLASLAAPAFRDMLMNQRIQAASFDLLASLTLTRSEAIKQNRSVTLASNGDQESWASGWQIFPADDVTAVVKEQGAYSGIVITAAADSVTYNRSGRVASGVPVQFTVTRPNLRDNMQARCISVTITGMPVSTRGGC